MVCNRSAMCLCPLQEQALAGSSSYVSTGEEAATASGPEWLHSDVGKSACRCVLVMPAPMM